MYVLGALFATGPIDTALAAPPAKKSQKRVAAAPTNRPPASAKPIYESIVVDANTGRVLHQVNADTKAYPASLTKMMTLYMLFDAMAQGKVRLDTPMKVSQFAASQSPSKLYLTPGSTIAVEPAIYALVTKSANDVAVVIAEHIGGTERKFAQMMTAKARSIGMTRSQFRNASGLPHKDQLSTARDMAILGKRLMTEFPEQFRYFSETEFPYRGVMIRTHNRVLLNYQGADGIKTGYTAASGFNLVSSARRGEHRLITVVFGGPSAAARDQHVMALMEAGFGVLQNNPAALAVAQNVDPFPAMPTTPTSVAGESTDEAAAEETDIASAAALASAGDYDDAIGAKIAAGEPAPPLAEMAALVPAPKGFIPRTAARSTGRAEAAALSSPVEAATPSATWGVQIGAFSDRNRAESYAADAAARIRSKFGNATSRVVTVKAGKRTLYRAQVVGLTRAQTSRACVLAADPAGAGCKQVQPDTRVAAN
jgi:D-alanyl-D-alanine carboxypeptidase